MCAACSRASSGSTSRHVTSSAFRLCSGRDIVTAFVRAWKRRCGWASCSEASRPRRGCRRARRDVADVVLGSAARSSGLCRCRRACRRGRCGYRARSAATSCSFANIVVLGGPARSSRLCERRGARRRCDLVEASSAFAIGVLEREATTSLAGARERRTSPANDLGRAAVVRRSDEEKDGAARSWRETVPSATSPSVRASARLSEGGSRSSPSTLLSEKRPPREAREGGVERTRRRGNRSTLPRDGDERRKVSRSRRRAPPCRRP